MGEQRDQWPEEERRRAPRVGIGAKVHIGGDADWAGTYATADLSATGAFVVSETPPPRGTTVTLDLEVDDDLTLERLVALVVHVRREASEPSARGCGLMFLRLGSAEARLLEETLETRRQTGS